MNQQHWTGGTTVGREHTELHEVIYGYFGPDTSINSYKSPDQQDHELTDVILAAGYRKAERVSYVVIARDGRFIQEFGGDKVRAEDFVRESNRDCKDMEIDWDYRVAEIVEAQP